MCKDLFINTNILTVLVLRYFIVNMTVQLEIDREEGEWPAVQARCIVCRKTIQDFNLTD